MALHADEKIIDPRMQVRRNAAAGLDAVHRRQHRRILVQHTLLAARPAFFERDVRDVFDRDDRFLAHEYPFSVARRRELSHSQSLTQPSASQNVST